MTITGITEAATDRDRQWFDRNPDRPLGPLVRRSCSPAHTLPPEAMH